MASEPANMVEELASLEKDEGESLDGLKIEQCAQALIDDFYRQDNHLSASDVDRAIARRNLRPEEAIEVWHILRAEGLEKEIEEPTASNTGGENTRGTEDNLRLDTVRAYLNEAGRLPLLSAQDERVLDRRIDLGMEAASTLEREPNHNRREELEALVDDGKIAREKMIRSNLRLVISIARHYTGQGLDLLEVIQEGNLGLIRAVELFDHRLGFKFSTYATWWIRQAVTRAIADKGRLIRLPVYAHDLLRKINKTAYKLEHELERPPTVRELAAHLDLKPGRVQALFDISRSVASLDKPIDDEGRTLGDVIPAATSLDPEDLAMEGLVKETIAGVLTCLTPQEQDVVRRRYGFDTNHPETLDAIGKTYGLTRERIRQIQAKALTKLRHPRRSRQLRDFAGVSMSVSPQSS